MPVEDRHSRNCELIIFDCDGVLVDSEIVVAKAYASSLSAAGIVISEEELLQRFVGVSDADMYRTLEQETGITLPADHDGLAQLAVRELFEKELQPLPGIHDLLGSLSTPVCVASSSTPSKLEFSLSLVNLYDRFAPNVFSSTMVARGKPAPDLFLYAAEKMGSAPERCLVIEDSVAGVEAAVAAGMPVIGFTGASHCQAGHADALGSIGAMEVARSATELEAIIDRISCRASR
jgi:HAD superfamily hydrolase (TIGR01509 family)